MILWQNHKTHKNKNKIKKLVKSLAILVEKKYN